MDCNCINIFSDSELDQLADASLNVLERAGVMYQSDVVLDALERAGASVDRAYERARLPRRMTEDIIHDQRKLQQQQARKNEDRRTPAPPDGPLPGIGLQIAQFYYDHERGERRRGNRQDLVRMVQFGEALDTGNRVSQVLLMHEEPPLVEPLEALLVLLEHSSRPGYTYPHFASQFPYLEEIGEIYAGDPKRLLIGGVFMVTPLRMDRRACDFAVESLRRGLGCGCSTQPVSGISAPVTRAGTIVLAAAEILGGWAALRALDPQTSLSGGIASGSVDMATGNVSFCSPESMVQDIGCVELFRRRFGGQVGVAGGADYTSAKFPGYQAGFEKAFEAMAIAAHTGGYPSLGAGLLDSGRMFSPLQLLIDRDFQSFLWRFAVGAEVNEDEIALDMITEIGSGIGRTYLDAEHTLRRFRQSLWFSQLADRSVWHEDAKEEQPDQRLLEHAQAQFTEVMGRYRKPDVDQDMLARVREVVARARRELHSAGV